MKLQGKHDISFSNVVRFLKIQGPGTHSLIAEDK